MINEEFEEKAREEAQSYKTVYSEDFRFDEVMKDPLRFDQDYSQRLYLLLKEKHYRDGFVAGAKWLQEKLKCCGNCKYEHCKGVCVSPEKCVDMNKWEMKE